MKPAGRTRSLLGRGLGGVDGLAPGGGVRRVGHLLRAACVVEVGVAEIVGAVHVGAAEGFGDDVDLRGRCGRGRVVRQVVAGEDVEDLDEDDAAGGWAAAR